MIYKNNSEVGLFVWEYWIAHNYLEKHDLNLKTVKVYPVDWHNINPPILLCNKYTHS